MHQMLLSMISSFSEVFGEEVISESDRRHWSSDEEFKNSVETMIPNGIPLNLCHLQNRGLELTNIIICTGAIVAIQDVHQHMYFTVEGNENKYSLAGAVHYSLVGENALFRVWYIVTSHF